MIKPFTVIAWFLFLCLTVVSCATVKPTENQIALASWIDFYYVDIFNQLGDPAFIYNDGLTGRVLAYENVLQRSNYNLIDNYNDDYHKTVYEIVWNQSTSRTTPSTIAQSYDILYIDKDGYVYSIQSNKSSREVRRSSENNAVVIGVVGAIIYLMLLIASE